MLWALSKDPRGRPQTGAEFVRALREAPEEAYETRLGRGVQAGE